MEIYPIKKSPKISKTFRCESCDYICSKQSEFNKHLSTNKHKNLQNPTIDNTCTNVFNCICGKSYKHSSTLYAHKKKCKDVSDNNTHDIPQNEFLPLSNDPTSEASIVLRLLKQNDEFKQLMVQQHKENVALQQQNHELNQQLLHAMKDGNGNVIHNTTTNNNNNNNNFNLHFFLNDTCKDAMNITDFIQNLDVQIEEIEYIGNHGYVSGMTKMIMDRLKGMDITKRPIHCTDIKRETMYIKDNDEWSKDTDELTKLRRILNYITMKNYRTVPKWKIAHPACEDIDTRDYNFCYKMMHVILGDAEDEQVKLDNKIIKTLAKGLFCK